MASKLSLTRLSLTRLSPCTSTLPSGLPSRSTLTMPIPTTTGVSVSIEPIKTATLNSQSAYFNAHFYKSITLILLFITALLCLGGCSETPSSDSDNANNDTVQSEGTINEDALTNGNEVLTILAGSELKDIEPLLPDIKANTGVELRLEYMGTLDGVNAISQGSDVDAAWFSHGKYLSLANRDRIKAQAPIMLSPVVMGIKQSKADALGWLDDNGAVKSTITWETIADSSQAGQLKYAMTNPAASNSGFTALMGVTSAFAGTADAPTAEDIQAAKPKLKEFFRGQALTSGSSGWLADAYVKQQNELDAIINYESVLMQLNQSGQLSEPLVMIYPKEGIVTADYPLTLLNFEKKDSYDKVVDYLKSEPVQQRLMTETSRRPVSNQVTLSDDFYNGLLVELPFPNSITLIDNLLIDFANELRNPAYSLFVLDVSGSMEGEGISQLRQALYALTGSRQGNGASASTSNVDNNSNEAQVGAARFTQFANNEIVGLQPFNDKTYAMHTYQISTQNLNKLREDVNSLSPSGGTAIYSALANSYNTLYEQKQKNEATRLQAGSASAPPPYYYSIVLMTDGINEDGIDYNEFANIYQQMRAEQQNIKTFVVLFGNADEAEMTQLANLTGGKVFDGRNGNLTDVFRKIRGYQ